MPAEQAYPKEVVAFIFIVLSIGAFCCLYYEIKRRNLLKKQHVFTILSSVALYIIISIVKYIKINGIPIGNLFARYSLIHLKFSKYLTGFFTSYEFIIFLSSNLLGLFIAKQYWNTKLSDIFFLSAISIVLFPFFALINLFIHVLIYGE